ncbi:ABC transporter permease [Aquimarina algiphila]|uniref:ABC transporter permease n=1 Tax=Aquimarina algiphila TaxID=2047982 RepID=UPI00232BCED4|nr:ABC transporter permease [Aquimarina algiphila]
MNTHIVKAIIRNVWKKKFLSSTKILGLIVGFTVFIFLLEKIKHETSYDTFWKDSESIYRVGLDLKYKDGEEVRSAKNFGGSSELLEAEIPGVVAQCNFGRDVVTIFNGPQQKIQDVDFVWSDPSFFSVFDRKIITAETNSLIENIHGIAISQSFAKKLYGEESPLGKELTVNEGWKFVVDAVFEDIPSNSHMNIDVIGTFKTLFYYLQNFDNKNQVLVDNPDYEYQRATPYETKRWQAPVQYRSYCYIKLDKNTSINAIESRLDGLLGKVALPQKLKEAKMNFILQPIADIHLKSKLDHELSVNGEQTQVFFLSIIILVVLLVCLINFINLNTITTLENAKNYSIRILNGSGYNQVFYLMFVETILFNIVAIIVSIPIAHYLIDSQLPIDGITFSTYALLGTIGIVVVGIASIVPFMSVIKNKAFSVVKKGDQKLHQKWTSQKVMVTLQFSITIVLMICTVGIYKQMQFMMDKELGFNGTQTIFSFTPMTMNQHPDLVSRLSTFKNVVSALGGVASFSASSSIPGKAITRLNDQVKAVVAAKPYPVTFNQISIDDGYLDTYDIPLIAGKNLNPESNWKSNGILINETALSKMGNIQADNVIGNAITIGNKNYRIQGVVEDYHHVSLHKTVQPTIYIQNLEWDHAVGYYSFKLKSNTIAGTMDQIAQIWNELYPKEEFIFNFSNTVFQNQYAKDQKFSQILNSSTILALFISCIGLLGVALFNTRKRVKEIGIRKVNGAKVKQILFTLNKDFIKWVTIAYVLACPIAWYALNIWLENFAYKTTLGLWVYVLAGLGALTIALLTVSWQSFIAASRNPIEALRDE